MHYSTEVVGILSIIHSIFPLLATFAGYMIFQVFYLQLRIIITANTMNFCVPRVEKKAGTLARKRELRDMLEQQDEGYEDDAFDGTPFRHRKPFLKVLCSLKINATFF